MLVGRRKHSNINVNILDFPTLQLLIISSGTLAGNNHLSDIILFRLLFPAATFSNSKWKKQPDLKSYGKASSSRERGEKSLKIGKHKGNSIWSSQVTDCRKLYFRIGSISEHLWVHLRWKLQVHKSSPWQSWEVACWDYDRLLKRYSICSGPLAFPGIQDIFGKIKASCKMLVLGEADREGRSGPAIILDIRVLLTPKPWTTRLTSSHLPSCSISSGQLLAV